MRSIESSTNRHRLTHGLYGGRGGQRGRGRGLRREMMRAWRVERCSVQTMWRTSGLRGIRRRTRRWGRRHRGMTWLTSWWTLMWRSQPFLHIGLGGDLEVLGGGGGRGAEYSFCRQEWSVAGSRRPGIITVGRAIPRRRVTAT
ncbi:hypothetical protein O6H91_01G058100 [Diphasiastrum complanatum]|uniref:Uncharacterized protein n=1 Tax=Diphasiastrum complanatum TaxID=34168 RepID=A0ACC2ERC6_DIPCM|nr:hypothetical protein O6H91_01G058100 [Diphasiastrum complanatum]